MDLAQYWFQSPAGGGAVIGNSLRFRGSQRLTRAFATSGDRSNYVLSMWLKKSKTGTVMYPASVNVAGSPYTSLRFNATDQIAFLNRNSANTDFDWIQASNNLYRDPSAWMHVVMQLKANIAHTYVNGIEVSYASNTNKGLNAVSAWNHTYTHVFGDDSRAGVNPFHGYMAETHFVDGQALSPTDFGEFNADGVWVPKTVTGLTYGLNGFYLDFSDPANIGADRSGNGNNFTPTGFELTDTTSTSYDWVADSPTDNYSTLNALNKTSAAVLSDANLTASNPTQASNQTNPATIYVNSGKWYAEFTKPITGREDCLGIITDKYVMPGSYYSNQKLFSHRSGSINYSTYGPIVFSSWMTAGDVISVRLDLDNQTFGISVNGGAFADVTITDYDGHVAGEYWTFFVGSGANVGTSEMTFNVNYGNRPFAHTPPAGFKPLSTAGLPAVAITNPSEHFQTILSDNPPVIPAPAAPGDAYGGGFYAGQIRDGNKVYNLIVAPVTSGALEGQLGGATPTTTLYKVNDDPDSGTFGNETNGSIPTLAGANGTYPMFDWCINNATGPNAGTYDATNAIGTGIGGFNDWYIPAKSEYEIIYRYLKPTTTANVIDGSGVNPNAVPPTGDYTSTDPAQTTSAIFQAGGGEDYTTTLQYWTATSASGFRSAWLKHFTDGLSAGTSQNNPANARAVRREFAYDAGILDYAQATFPNGLWWIKDRANSNQHQFVDSVRGGSLALQCPASGGQVAYVAPTGNSVAWCWNTGTGTVTNSDGTVPCTLSANPTAGFSIATWTAAGGSTIGHGLSETPEFIIMKPTGVTDSFFVYHKDIGAGKYLRLNQSVAPVTDAAIWSVAPTSAVFSPGSGIGPSYGSMVAYCWHSVPGYSAFGSYVSNNNADGPFIYTGFRPAWVLTKRIDTGDTFASWYIRDSERSAYNPVDISTVLTPNETWQEGITPNGGTGAPGSGPWCDLLSNGFKIRTTGTGYNPSGGTHIYIAFAEHCFGGANISPAPAR